MIIETVIVGVVVGLVLGLTGAGGSIFAVPLYIMLLNLPINDAMGLALGAVCVAALVGILLRNTERDLDWKTGLMLAAAGMLTAPLGRWCGAQINESLLLIAFALLATGLAFRMWRQASGNHGVTYVVRSTALPLQNAQGETAVTESQSGTHALLPAGFFIGWLSGLFGVGGGFLIVPLLTLHFGMSIHRAVGTSLIVIALVSAAGFSYHLLAIAEVPTSILGFTCIGSVVGILAGTLVAKKLAGPRLQKLFAFSVISLMAITLSRTLS